MCLLIQRESGWSDKPIKTSSKAQGNRPGSELAHAASVVVLRLSLFWMILDGYFKAARKFCHHPVLYLFHVLSDHVF